MTNEELAAWIKDRIVLSFEHDTVEVRKEWVGDTEFCCVQIFRGEGDAKRELGGFRFDASFIERNPKQLEFLLHQNSRDLAYAISEVKW